MEQIVRGTGPEPVQEEVNVMRAQYMKKNVGVEVATQVSILFNNEHIII